MSPEEVAAFSQIASDSLGGESENTRTWKRQGPNDGNDTYDVLIASVKQSTSLDSIFLASAKRVRTAAPERAVPGP